MSRATFNALERKVATEYRAKGYGAARSERIAQAVAGKTAHRKWAKSGTPAAVKRQRSCVRDGMRAHRGETGAQHRRSFAEVARRCATKARKARRG